MTKEYCDKCEKEITNEYHMAFFVDISAFKKKFYTLCQECGEEMIKQLDKKIK